MRLGHTLALIVGPWLCFGAPACDGDKKTTEAGAAEVGKTESDKAQGAAGAGGCDEAHGKDVYEEMIAWCELSEKVADDQIPLAPWKPAPADKPLDARIEVRPGGVSTRWGSETALADLPSVLEEERDLAKRRGRTVQGWSLIIGGDTPRAEVAAVLETLANSGQKTGSVVLTVEPTGEVPQPRDPKRLAALNAKVGSADPSQKASLLANEVQSAMPPCPGMTEAFRAVATAPANERCTVLARGLSQGLVSCGCPKEDEMLTLVYGISMGFEPPKRLTTTVPTTIDPAATPRAGATWGEIVAGMDEAAMKTLWVD
ncbi:MAG: hypothetical protein AAF799_25600 [Myxococcota bacterium]